MLRLFYSFNPLTFLLLAVYTVLINLHTLLHPFPATGDYQFYLSHLIFDQWLHIRALPLQALNIILLLIIFGQGILLSVLMQSFKLIAKPSLLPAMTYVLLCSLFPQLLESPAEIICVLLLLWLLNKLFNVYNKARADGSYLDAGLLTGLLSLIFFPASLFILFGWFSLVRLRSSNFREFAVFLSGLLVILFLAFTGVFWFDALPELMKGQFYFPLPPFETGDLFETIPLIKIILLTLALILSLIFLSNRYTANLIQIRKYLSTFIWLLLYAAITIFFNRPVSTASLSLLMLPAAFFISYYFYYSKATLYTELVHAGLITATFMFQYINFVS